MKKNVLFVLITVGAVLLLIYPQALKAQSKQLSDGTKSAVQEMTIKGKIVKEADRYYIQGQTPPEVFNILNPDSSTLDKIIKNNKSVKIDVRVVMGDNVEIKNINGKPYRQNKEK